MNLLIADDELFIRKGLLSLDWKSIGIEEVYSACNGLEAKELLLSVPLDIVIFDIQMPGMTGIDLAKMIKEYSLDTAVILLTGYAEFEYAQQAIRNNVYEYLLKPFSPREILQTAENVKRQLEQKRYQKELVRERENAAGVFDTVTQVKNHFSKASPIVKDILTDMSNEFTGTVTLGDLAERYHFSEGYISKKIRQETGYSFIEILIAIRLMNAGLLLLNGDKINQVCEKSGFNDQRYFSQVFKRTFGCSPSEYKKQEHDISDLRFHKILADTAKKTAEQTYEK